MEIKTDNGWYHINDIKPNYGENVIVILERESLPGGCSYGFNVRESIYRGDHFEKENDYWHVRYWKRKELIPYPDGIVKKEIEECNNHNISPYRIIEHQRKCGIEVKNV